MKILLVLYCAHIWCSSLSFSFKILPSSAVANEPKKLNMTKYVYLGSAETSTSINNVHYYSDNATEFQEINATQVADTMCNATSEEGPQNIRKRRSIHYFDEGQLTATVMPDTVDFSVLSDEFLCCLHTNVEPGFYQMLPNRNIYVPLYKTEFNASNYAINKGLLFICPKFFPPDEFEEKFSLKVITIETVGMSISSVCIILHMLMFCITAKLRNFPGYYLFSLCIALLFTYTISFIQMIIHEQADCRVIGMFKMYSLLSSFFWMNVVSFDVWYAIRLATCKLRLSTHRSMIFRFIMYSIYGWGMPVLFIIIGVIVDNVSDEKKYHFLFNAVTCWFKNKWALLFYFALPVFVLLVLNLIFFVKSFLMIARTRSDSGSQDSYDLRSQLFLSLRLGSVMGLTWVFGVIASLSQREWIAYLNSVCTALQGVFIFFSFTVNEKTRRACRKMMNKKMSILSLQTSVN